MKTLMRDGSKEVQMTDNRKAKWGRGMSRFCITRFEKLSPYQDSGDEAYEKERQVGLEFNHGYVIF